jgi:hypothetical protein
VKHERYHESGGMSFSAMISLRFVIGLGKATMRPVAYPGAGADIQPVANGSRLKAREDKRETIGRRYDV